MRRYSSPLPFPTLTPSLTPRLLFVGQFKNRNQLYYIINQTIRVTHNFFQVAKNKNLAI